MIRRVALLLAAVVALALGMTSGSASAQRGPGRIDLVSQTTFVADDEVSVNVRLPNLEPGRQMLVRVFRPIDEPDRILDTIQNPPTENSDLANFIIDDLTEIAVGSGDLFTITLPDEEIGEILRREPGAIPIRIDLIDNENLILDTLVTFVIVEDTTLSARIDLGFVADARSPLSHRVDAIEIDPTATVDRVAAAVADAPAPALVSFTPETLTALADPGTDRGLSAIDDIRRLLDGHLLPLSPWVSIDEEAWRLAGESERVFGLFAEGQEATETFLGRTPVPIVHMDPDTTANTVGLLRSVGVTGGVVEPTQLDELTIERADRRPIEVLDTNGITMPVLLIDRAFEAGLVGDDPELIAQHRFTELLFEAKRVGTDRGIVLDLTTVDQVPLTLLLDLIEATDRLGLASVDELITRPPARDAEGAVLRVELLSAPPGDVGGAASDLRLTESVLASYTAMVSPADGPIAPLRTVLRAAMSDELDADVHRTFTDTVFDLVAAGTADFAVVESSRVTLATRAATLPVTIHNDQNLTMNVIVRTTSEKLRFPDGEELQLVLAPGLNELEIPVETVTSGDARILITVTSPDGRLDLANGSVNVRSTAISGLGLTVSLVSLAILLTWWLRTIIRVRRSRRAATVSFTPSADDGNPAVSVNKESTS
ncbi:MAG: hypothetical protein CL419_04600 [Acidimicrobiaceae bacterium]|nr:hypothetical protein [Acidimicrobiaceae bacterium]